MPEAQTLTRPRTCPGCGAEFSPRMHGQRRQRYTLQTYCTQRCYTANGPYGSARNGRLEEQHVAREMRPA